MAIVRPLCRVDAPPVVILEFAAIDAPASPLLAPAAIAGSGDNIALMLSTLIERKAAAGIDFGEAI